MAVKNAEEMRQQLSDKNKRLILFGCICLMLAIAAYGLSLSTIQGPMLSAIGGDAYFSLITIIASLAMCVMTPVGGRLGDIYGTRKVILYSGLLSIVTGVLLPFVHNIIVFVLLRFLFSIGQGIMASLPFILAREVVEPKEMSKVMGFLSAAMALGSFLGSFLAGYFTDKNMLPLAIIFPVIFLVIGIPLIYYNVPKKEEDHSLHLDFKGLIVLTIALSAIFLSLNFAPNIGWTSPLILLGCIVGIIAIYLFIMVEKRAAVPLIPLTIFANKQYTMLLILAFLSVFYMIAMNVYVPNGAQQLMKVSVAASGSLQIPRTIISVLLPSFCGIWLAKNQKKHTWIALSIAGACIGLAFSGLVFMGVNMPLWFVMAMLALTGIADSFRTVSITPAAQTLLPPKDLGVGTSLIGFFISLSNLIASSVYGIAYDTLRHATPGARGITDGIDTVFLIAAFTGYLLLVLTVFVYRKMSMRTILQKK